MAATAEDDKLSAAAEALGLDMSDSQRQALLAYPRQMQRWNKTYNLTAIRDAEQMLVQHIFDSLAAVKPLREALARTRRGGAGSVVDVGSGGGLPGVVLAIMCPQWQVCCVDAVEKKMAFVRQMSGVLGLPNLRAVHARIEALAPMEADIVVSRAFASLLDFATLAGAHVAPQGWLAAMKGREPREEIAALHEQGRWRLRHVQPLRVPQLDAQRCLVWMSRQGNA